MPPIVNVREISRREQSLLIIDRGFRKIALVSNCALEIIEQKYIAIGMKLTAADVLGDLAAPEVSRINRKAREIGSRGIGGGRDGLIDEYTGG